MNEYKVRPMTQLDLEQVLEWRNHPYVRSCMYNSKIISLDEHYAWYAKAVKNPAINLLVFERSKKACGFVNITRTRCSSVAEWGFYLAPEAPKGCGRELGKSALDYAFQHLELHKVCGEALGFNDQSIIFHKKLGFSEEGRLRDQHFDGVKFHDVVCFGLLKNEWNMLGDK